MEEIYLFIICISLRFKILFYSIFKFPFKNNYFSLRYNVKSIKDHCFLAEINSVL